MLLICRPVHYRLRAPSRNAGRVASFWCTRSTYTPSRRAQPVADVILEAARRVRVDTIVLGTHGKSGVSRLVLGSVSEEVLERSPVAVLLVHQPAARSPVLAGLPGGQAAHAQPRGQDDH